MKGSDRRLLLMVVAVALLTMSSGLAWAHCDTESGPVAVDARKALETGEFVAAAIWVGDDQNEELRATFEQCLPVYEMGGEAGALAERHFIEATVRLHRQAEGFTYTGLKPAQPLPADIATAEQALETGKLQPVSKLLEAKLEKKLKSVFDQALEARESKDEDLAAGREWADAYVKYVIYVHGLYETIEAGPEHGVGE